MSLASEYAAALAVVAADKATTKDTEPPALAESNVRFSVTDEGDMLVSPTGSGAPVVTPARALAVAAWITATFG